MRGALCSSVHTQQAPAEHAGGCSAQVVHRLHGQDMYSMQSQLTCVLQSANPGSFVS